MKARIKEDKLDKMIHEEEEKLEKEAQSNAVEENEDENRENNGENQKKVAITLPDPDPWAVEELNRLVEKIKQDHSNLDHVSLNIRYLRHIAEASDIYNVSRGMLEHDGKYGPHPLTCDTINKLWHKIPLTPLEDKEDEWEPCKGSETEDCHKRAPFILRVKQPDGSYVYSDERRVIGLENGNQYWLGSLVDIYNELRPITFPYTVDERRSFANTMSFLTKKYTDKEKKGLYRRGSRVYDTLGVFSIVTPRGEVIPVGRYFKWDENGQKVQITYEEFLERKAMSDAWVTKALKKAEKAAKTAKAGNAGGKNDG